MKHQSIKTATLKAEFQGKVPQVVHWDDKLIAGLTGKEQVDQLPVIVSGKGVYQLLTVAKLTSGTGEAQASAVYSPWTMATHHARWLSKVFYSLKMWMFRGQFHLMCIFAAHVYLRVQTTDLKPVSALYHDYQLLISLLDYLAINSKISKLTSMKMANHLWYLSPEKVGLAFFDNSIDYDTKKQMVEAVKLVEEEQISVDLRTFKEHYQRRKLVAVSTTSGPSSSKVIS
ncbi:hypothetical protein QYM36_009621 [Artemia franciscana]|uniref:Uncharacterized protein n=1 Tax=Artemia franciscana TaxID=6661 RepID=A0AA88I1Y9_ARTSF|nr:hypothetical protein QYM36_009621 [Artemia franciscana]